MHPIILQTGYFTVHSWGLMLSIGILAGLWLARNHAAQQGLDREVLLDLALWLVVGGLLGARSFYVAVYEPGYYLSHPWEIFMFWKAGLVYYGAFLGGIVAGLIFMYNRKLPFWSLADLVAPSLALGYGVVRIGCFLNGCCYGKPSNVAWAVVFPNLGDHVTRHPTQLYLSLVGFGLAWWLHRLQSVKRFQGQVFLTYAIAYGILRWFVETFRENLTIIGSVTVAQLVSIALISWAMVYYYRRSRLI